MTSQYSSQVYSARTFCTVEAPNSLRPMWLKSGKYDLDHVSLLITQTGGGCRATNYIGYIRRALVDAGMAHVPVLSLNASGLESQPGFKITPALLHRAMMALMTGDVLMRVLYRTRPYEATSGSADALYEKWSGRAEVQLKSLSIRKYHKLIQGIVDEFDAIVMACFLSWTMLTAHI